MRSGQKSPEVARSPGSCRQCRMLLNPQLLQTESSQRQPSTSQTSALDKDRATFETPLLPSRENCKVWVKVMRLSVSLAWIDCNMCGTDTRTCVNFVWVIHSPCSCLSFAQIHIGFISRVVANNSTCCTHLTFLMLTLKTTIFIPPVPVFQKDIPYDSKGLAQVAQMRAFGLNPKVEGSSPPVSILFYVSNTSTLFKEHPFVSRNWMLLPAHRWLFQMFTNKNIHI